MCADIVATLAVKGTLPLVQVQGGIAEENLSRKPIALQGASHEI